MTVDDRQAKVTWNTQALQSCSNDVSRSGFAVTLTSGSATRFAVLPASSVEYVVPTDNMLSIGTWTATVRAFSGLDSQTSSTSFVIQKTGPTLPPVFNSPADLSLQPRTFSVRYSIPTFPAGYYDPPIAEAKLYFNSTSGALAHSVNCILENAATRMYNCTVIVPTDITGFVQFQAVVSNGFGYSFSDIRIIYVDSCPATAASSVPAMPSSPADNAIVAVNDITLAWDPTLVGADCGYLTADRSFTVVVESNGTAIQTHSVSGRTIAITGLTAGSKYTWKVRPYLLTNTWSTRSFSTCDPAALPTVTLLTPAASATVTLPLTVSWTPISWLGCGATSIDVDVDGAPVATIASATTESSVTLDSKKLPQTGSFTVTVHARQGSTVASASRTFTVCDPDVPAGPVLVSPTDGSELNTTLGLSWSSVQISGDCLSSPTVSYRVLIGTSKDGELTLFTTTTSTSLAPLNLNTSGVFYWTVEATNGVHVSVRPAPFSFYSCLQRAPQQFSLNTPTSAGGANSPVQFEWDSTSFGDDCPSGGVTQNGGYTFRLLSAFDAGATLNTTLNLEPAITKLSIDIAVTGEYTWWVEKFSDVGSIETTHRNFHVCSVGAPDAPAITAMPSTVISPPTFSWTAVTNWGDSCTGAMGLDHKYLVYIGRTGVSEERFVGETTGTSLTLEASQVLRGSMWLRVIATNGVRASASEAFFEACTATPPPEPVLVFPASATVNLPRNLNFTIVPINIWGETCGADNSGWYRLYIADPMQTAEATVVSAVHSGTATYDALGFAEIPATLAIQTWSWSATANNSLGLESSRATERTIRICENIAPEMPVFTEPLNGTVVSVYTFTVSWQAYLSTYFGAVCPNATSSRVLTPLLRLMWSYHPDVNFTLVNYILDETTRPCPYGSMPTEFPRDTDIYLRLMSSNGLMTTMSPPLWLRTGSHNCEDILCNLEHGSCNKLNLTCECNAGFSGEGCEHDDIWGRTLKIIIGVVVGGVGLIVIIAIIVIVVVKKYYRGGRRIILEPPNFSELRTPPVKMPAFPPDVNAVPDYAMLEQAALSDSGFDMMWEVMKNTAITEADGFAKAMVYIYQRQNKGLELIFFLIMREIRETTEPNLLFRANSPATRAFKFYSKMIGLPYLFQTLAVLLQGVLRDIEDAEEDQKKKQHKSSGGGGDDAASSSSIKLAQADADPEQADACSDESINILTLQLACQKFLLQIMRSDKTCPGEIKHICAFIRSQLEAKFPKQIYKGLGAFVFLRFYNTAITVPETYGLMPHAPTGIARKQLILISKVLQNLANGVQFGAKEQFMTKLNSLITNSQQQYERFLDKLCDNTAALSEPVPINDESYQNSLSTLLAQLYTISRNDPDKLNTLHLTQPLLDTVSASVPTAKREHKKRKHHADKAPAVDEQSHLLDPSQGSPAVQ